MVSFQIITNLVLFAGFSVPKLNQLGGVHSFSDGKYNSEDNGNYAIPQSEHMMNHQQIMLNSIPTEMNIFETQSGRTMLPSHFEQEFNSAMTYLENYVQLQDQFPGNPINLLLKTNNYEHTLNYPRTCARYEYDEAFQENQNPQILLNPVYESSSINIETNIRKRGIRGRDCYKNHSLGSEECWDNKFKNGTEPIPPPFEHVNEVSTAIKIAYYVVVVILVLQVASSIYTPLFCIDSKFCQLAEPFNYVVMLGFMSFAVVLWIVLFVLLVPEAYKENILPEKFKNPEYNYSIGSGFWKFFCGGLIPFVAAIIIFFHKQLCNMFNCCGKRDKKDYELSELVANSN
ncbi:hypothetical protein GCK72_022913 [Caenorhabditis remanei]|uniref:Uncharacterized protein n=1 Tax=Caenorhabditis remanei TaxID=31234 RepID=A0A6A5FV51_CAERE|nr:hypothetical protein GCK72_022913 [Caenorhabditis remanei]KAF1746457.1 hypothetical protein GCK72_022913 [Caenorhabditis remanei]